MFLSLIAGITGVLLFTRDFFVSLPSSGRYPVWFLLIPGLVAFGVVFGIGTILFRLLGWRILNNDRTDDQLNGGT